MKWGEENLGEINSLLSWTNPSPSLDSQPEEAEQSKVALVPNLANDMIVVYSPITFRIDLSSQQVSWQKLYALALEHASPSTSRAIKANTS